MHGHTHIKVVAFNSNLYVVTLNKQPNNWLFPLLFIFLPTLKYPGSYPRLGITDLKGLGAGSLFLQCSWEKPHMYSLAST